MPLWWGRSKEGKKRKKSKRERIIEAIQQKFKNASEKMHNDKSEESIRHCIGTRSEKRSQSAVASRSSSPSSSRYVSRCQSFSERPLSKRLPLPGSQLPTVSDANSEICLPSIMERASGSKQSPYFPLPTPGDVSNRGYPTDAEGYIDTASVSSDSSGFSGDSSDSHLISPLATDCEIGNLTTINGSFRKQSPVTFQNDLGSSNRAPQLCSVKNLSISPKQSCLHLQNLKVRTCGLFSAPESSTSSPSKSPVRELGPDHVLNSELQTRKPCTYVSSGNYSSPGSGQNSDVGDLPGQLFLPLNRYSPECSPIPSPRMTSPGPRSRIHSGTATPLHSRAGAFSSELTTRRPDDGTQQTHPLPLPPIAATSFCLSPNYSSSTTPSAPRSLVSSDVHTPRNISCPVSPVRQRFSPSGTLDVAGRVHTVPVVSPHTASGPSTPVNDSGRTISFHRNKQLMFSHEAVGLMPSSHDGFCYHDPRHDAVRGTTLSSRDVISSDNDSLPTNYTRADRREFYNVPQMPTRECVRMNTYLERQACTPPRHGNTNGM